MQIITLYNEASHGGAPQWNILSGGIFDLNTSAKGAMYLSKPRNGKSKSAGLFVSIDMLLDQRIRIVSETGDSINAFTKHRLIVSRASFEKELPVERKIMVPEQSTTENDRRKAVWLPDPNWSIDYDDWRIGYEHCAQRLMDDFYILAPGQELLLWEPNSRIKWSILWDGELFWTSEGWCMGQLAHRTAIVAKRRLLDTVVHVGPGLANVTATTDDPRFRDPTCGGRIL